MRRTTRLIVVLSLALSPCFVFACGDKFIFTGSNGRLEMASGAVTPAKVVIYRDVGTDTTSVMFDPALPQVLQEAGHSASAVDGTDALVASAATADIVLVEYRSARTIRDQLQASRENAIVVPVLDRAARSALSAAKREFGVVLNVPASAGALLRAIDRAMSKK